MSCRPSFAPPLRVSVGGNALKYYSSVRLDVRRKESLRDNTGITVKVKVSRVRGGGSCFLRVARDPSAPTSTGFFAGETKLQPPHGEAVVVEGATGGILRTRVRAETWFGLAVSLHGARCTAVGVSLVAW